MALDFNQWMMSRGGPAAVFSGGRDPRADYAAYLAANKPIEQQTLGELEADPQQGDYYQNVLATRLKEGESAQAEQDYAGAEDAVRKTMGADIDEFQGLAPLASRRLLGSLNARGLGTSVMAGGQGTGALTGLAQRHAKGLGDIKLGYEDLLGNLAEQKKRGGIDTANFYRDFSLAKQNAKSKEAGVLDYLSAGIGAASAFI